MMDRHLPVISVVIPCFKQAHFLSEAIASVLAQTFADHEIVVVDDGSPDDTSEVTGRYRCVKYVRQDHLGGEVARNRGIEESRGRYLVFLDADDRLLPHHFETSLKAFHAHPEVAFVCGDYQWFGGDDTWHVHQCTPMPDHYATLLRFNFIGALQCAMFRRDVIARVGGFRVGMRACQDQELYLRIARQYPIYCHHEVVAEYRRHESQLTGNAARMLRMSMIMLRWQRPYIRGKPQYEEAYRSGVQFRQRLYGGTIFWGLVSAVKAGRWREATEAFLTLVRFHPRGLFGPIVQRFSLRKAKPRSEAPQ